MYPLAYRLTAPIGVFDSGVGGLSVWRYIASMLPAESTIYLADQAHVPYGPREQSQVRFFSDGITRYLIQNGAKLIVVACNTASGAALHWLREEYAGFPFVGMEPALKPATERTQTGSIGVIATPTTFNGDLYHSLVDRFGSNAEIHTHTCPGLVRQIESGDLLKQQTKTIIRDCVTPLLEHDIDHLVLGCTHYPFVAETIQETAGKHVTLIDPAPAVVRQVERVLASHNLLVSQDNIPQHRMVTSGNSVRFSRIITQLTGHVHPVSNVSWQNGMLKDNTSV